jgi:hypothetical protein
MQITLKLYSGFNQSQTMRGAMWILEIYGDGDDAGADGDVDGEASPYTKEE